MLYGRTSKIKFMQQIMIKLEVNNTIKKMNEWEKENRGQFSFTIEKNYKYKQNKDIN